MGIQRSSDVHGRIHIMSLGYSDKFFFWFVSFIIFDEHRSVLWKMLLHGSYLMLNFFFVSIRDFCRKHKFSRSVPEIRLGKLNNNPLNIQQRMSRFTI